MSTTTTDVAIIGAGHNGLVAAIMLARHGLQITVFEEKASVGGAAKTEYPFANAPKLGISSGAYLLGLMPPELITKLGATFPLIRRDPHYFLPTTDRRYLLFGSDVEAMRQQFLAFFSAQDWEAHQALTQEIAQIREDLAPSWLEEPLSLADTAARYIRPALRETFIDLVTCPVEDYLARFGFASDLLVAMYAVTDGFPGLHGGFGTPATGMNFLVHNMCRLPGADGTWMIVRGGMGSVANELARLATEAGARIMTGAGVQHIATHGEQVVGVVLMDGREIKAKVVLSNADPFRMRALVGREKFPSAFNAKLDNFKRPGTTLKVNLALDQLPTFRCLPHNRGQHHATIHLLPQEGDVIRRIRTAFEQAQAGELADFPPIEWYMHTPIDPTLQDDQGRHNAAFFVQWVPYELKGTTWDAAEERYVRHLLSIADEFAPSFSRSVVDVFTLTPKKIEQHFGISYGHIHHVDNTFGFDQRMPYATPIAGLYSCSAGCHPAGSVIGAAGHNAAMRIVKDLGLRTEALA
ncbi:MAG TPA: NAD(P)/FAD-dependent oxidoreductase [Alphaproteobacteria bacterium]|nr:NAD(P)/FAD-dependent oxidoreductase [Alphaproteobacteria bacterium]